MLAHAVTFSNGRRLQKKSLLNIKSQFCRGYGIGYVAIVLNSPIKEMIGKTIIVDSKTKDSTIFNQYPDKINKKNSFPKTIYRDTLPNIETTLK